MPIKIMKLAPSISLAILISGFEPALAESQVADTILDHGRIYTQSSSAPWVEAVAIKDGIIIAAGSSKELARLRGAATQVVDLKGKMAMPGINDAHVHPVWGGLKNLYSCNFPFSSTPNEVAEKIKSCVRNQPEVTWIQGGNWSSTFFEKNNIESPVSWLDAISGDKAIVLKDDTNHHVWANSKAMQLLGINESSQVFQGSTFVKDPNTGKLNGLLMEAGSHLRNLIPDWTEDQYSEAVRYSIKRANSLGITGVKDADSNEPVAKAYHRIDTKEGLNAHVAVSLRIPGPKSKNNFVMEEFARLRDSYRSKHVNSDFVKIYLDGVPTSSMSAAMLEAYPGHEPHKGDLLVKPEVLKETMAELDGMGFTVKTHATGDGAIRTALDAIDYSRKKNGSSVLRHELAHAEFISDSDMPRIKSLNVTADFSPYIWFPSSLQDSIHAAIGERAKHAWPAKALIESGALVVAGSDWPAGVEDITPWIGIESLITRANPNGKAEGTLWKEQAIKLEDALKIFTINGAKALKADAITGSIEAGKSADIIVLNKNLFDIPPEEISETQVLMTFFEGRKVYDKE